MNNRKIITYVGIFLTAICIVGLLYWLTYTIPSDEEVARLTQKFQQADRNILSNNTLKELLQMNANGEFPITIDENNLGKNKPF